jgi:hypothetical protein
MTVGVGWFDKPKHGASQKYFYKRLKNNKMIVLWSCANFPNWEISCHFKN